MQHCFKLLSDHVFSPHSREVVGATRSGLQGGTTLLVERMDRIANRLLVAGECLCDARNRFPSV